jgi:ankyrin repeat protein
MRFPLTSTKQQTGRFIPDKSNIWRDCVDGYYDWVKEHINEGAPLNEADHCGDPPLLLAAGNGHTAVCDLLISEGADIQQAGLMKDTPLQRAAHNGHYKQYVFSWRMVPKWTLWIWARTPLYTGRRCEGTWKS